MKYAFVDIILVVIGILIALSTNKWNETRKNKSTESEYYCKLLDEFELDRQNIAELYKESESKIETSKQLLLDLDSKEKDKSYILINYLQGLRTNAFVPSKVILAIHFFCLDYMPFYYSINASRLRHACAFIKIYSV